MGSDAPPDWLVTPPEGWTADDLERLPDEAPHCEVLDGALIVMGSQTDFHSCVTYCLAGALGAEARMRMHIRLDRINRFEPDVLVTVPGLSHDRDRTCYLPDEVALVAEVVSGNSYYRDRVVKPQKYAAAGIPHFWRVEGERGVTVVHAYELDGGAYVETAVERTTLTLERPFPLSIRVDQLYSGVT